jgi:hypothetical protein
MKEVNYVQLVLLIYFSDYSLVSVAEYEIQVIFTPVYECLVDRRLKCRCFIDATKITQNLRSIYYFCS